MYSCKHCEYVCESSSSISNHYKYSHPKNNPIDLICDKCNKQCLSLSGLNYHKKSCDGKKEKDIYICPKCGFEIKSSREKHLNYCKGNGPRSKKVKRKEVWNKGLTKETDERVRKIGQSIKERYSNGLTPKHSKETKELLSKILYERYSNGWESKAGRCKKYDYESIIAGKIKVDGRWEYVVAEYLDTLNVKWIRNKKRFKYFNKIKNKYSTYCPDFYLVDLDTYIEVKGYITELDQCKWDHFKSMLEIWDKSKMVSLGLIDKVNEMISREKLTSKH